MVTKTRAGTPLTITQEASRHIAQVLAHVLADTYILYMKTQNFHWNIVDERFFFLHEMLDKQYHELAEAIDELAERIRTLNFKAPGSLRQLLELSSLEEADNDLNANLMLRQLLEDHRALANKIRPQIPDAQKYGDEGTADLFIERLRYHEKTAWMLQSHFNEELL